MEANGNGKSPGGKGSDEKPDRGKTQESSPQREAVIQQAHLLVEKLSTLGSAQVSPEGKPVLEQIDIIAKTEYVGFGDEIFPVKNFETTQKWYQENVGFEYVEGAGEVGNQRALLFLDNFVLEVGNFTDDRSLAEIGSTEKSNDLIRLNKLGFKIHNFSEAYEKAKENELKIKYENLDPENGDLYFILEDSEKNLIQFPAN